MWQRVFFLPLLSRNFDDQSSSNFHKFVILCKWWDTPSEKTGLWLPNVPSVVEFKRTERVTFFYYRSNPQPSSIMSLVKPGSYCMRMQMSTIFDVTGPFSQVNWREWFVANDCEVKIRIIWIKDIKMRKNISAQGSSWGAKKKTSCYKWRVVRCVFSSVWKLYSQGRWRQILGHPMIFSMLGLMRA